MASLSSPCLYPDRGRKGVFYANGCVGGKPFSSYPKTPFVGSFPVRLLLVGNALNKPLQRNQLVPCIKCENRDESYDDVSVERPPYYSYLDSTSGQLEPASGARASIPGEEYWPEGTASRVRAAKAPEPTGKSVGSPSYGQNPGSRRKKNRTLAAVAHDSSEVAEIDSSDPIIPDISEDVIEEPKDATSQYVVYQTEPDEEETGFELDKKLGNPHPFIDPEKKKPIEEPRTSEELWWNWRKPEKEQWSRWQRRKPDVETVFLKAMAETGQIKLYGENPTLTEASLYRARRHLYKEERLQAEQERLERIGPIAFYAEWVEAWKRDTSKDAIKKHFEETGEDENAQMIEMFQNQTEREFRIMMGTDIRIRRDPLAMRMREDQIKQIWGGDPVYPTINYIQDPNEIIDYRGPDFHEPTPDMLDFLKELGSKGHECQAGLDTTPMFETPSRKLKKRKSLVLCDWGAGCRHGKIISREELEEILAKEKNEEIEVTDMDDAMAQAIDIGENDDGEDSEAEGDEEAEEKITRNWSVLKSSPHLNKSKGKPKKEDPASLEGAIDDSENLTDFLMDFEEDE